MPKKVFTPEQIVTVLRQIEVAIGQGQTTPIACREARISDGHSGLIKSKQPPRIP
jgi:hypothetical protein